jgi:hypothetical protein
VLLRLFLLAAGKVESNGGANEFLQRRFVDLVAFADVNGARCFGVKTGVEEAMSMI